MVYLLSNPKICKSHDEVAAVSHKYGILGLNKRMARWKTVKKKMQTGLAR
jgi:hypothetical protein